MTTPAEAAKVLAKCSCFDPVFSKPDAALATGWAEAFSRYELELVDLLAAVTNHYCECADRAMPSHLIAQARKLRRERSERETAIERRAREGRIDHQLEARMTALGNAFAIDR
ncbi:hypothetical protein G4X40_19865 [Rhodococcus sp. D2-41]|uniref:hypothetical protein n=1 Tax=Speluncibacter jeojiensis TaxID=2710754 RepID=UPI0024102C9C|nr:hypothetical protein [Rhodococcus sp. D2-41]MDG3012401.1 hypothetical protein [Rhodococcus sp. D2-41]